MNNIKPSSFALRFLKSFCPESLYEEIEGDLIQKLQQDVKTLGEKKAKRRLVWNVIRFFRPGIILRNNRKMIMNTDLLCNNLKMSLRQFLKAPGFSFIHTFGTTAGLAAVLIIYLYLRFEISYDSFHPQSENIYRINLNVSKEGRVISQSARTSPVFGARVGNFPEIEKYSRAVLLGEVIVGSESNNIREQRVLMTDPAHFQLFRYQILWGNANTALSEPLSVMLSHGVSQKLFGEENPIGKTIKINSENFDGTAEFEVKGVFENQKENAHLRPEILISYTTLHHFIGSRFDEAWDWQNLYTYVRTVDDADVRSIENKLSEVIKQEQGEALKKRQEEWGIHLQSVESIHTTTSLTGEFEPGTSFANIIMLAIVAIFIIIVVLTNAINLAISKSSSRAKEVGVRKVSGAYRFQLIVQFLSESFLINFLSVLVACLIVSLSYPHLTDYINLHSLSGRQLINSLWLPAASYLLVGTLVSGLYPAILLSGYSPSRAFRGIGYLPRSGFGLRRSLLAVQFTISIVLIVGTLTIWQQLQFMNGYDLGLDIHNKLVVRTAHVQDKDNNTLAQVFRDEIRKIPSVNGIVSLNEIPGNEVYWRSDNFSRNGLTPSTVFSWLTVGDHYFDLLKIPTVTGRSFKPQTDNYKSSVILNETAVEAFGFSNSHEAVGSKIEIDTREVEIVGVIKNFHQEGLSKKIEPTVFRYSPGALNYFVLDISSTSESNLQQVEQTFKRIFPDSPYEYFFLDEHFNKQYQSEKLFSKAGIGLTLFSLVLAAIGLAGLSLQTISQRTKELGIRKILGASAHRLVFFLSKEYFIMLGIAVMISLPLSFAVFTEWLNRFAFKVNLSSWIFFIPIVVIFVVSSISIGWQTMRAVFVNPVESLKYE